MGRLGNFLVSCFAVVIYYLWTPFFTLLILISLPITIPVHFLLIKFNKRGFFFWKSGHLVVDIFSKLAFEVRNDFEDQPINLRNRVVQLAHKFNLRNQALAIVADKSKFGGRDLIMTGISLKTESCKSCSWLHSHIDTEIKNRGLTWNSY